MIVGVSRKPAAAAETIRRADRDDRLVLCRYLRRGVAGQCTAEAIDPDGPVLICVKHAAEVMTMLSERIADAQTGGRP